MPGSRSTEPYSIGRASVRCEIIIPPIRAIYIYMLYTLYITIYIILFAHLSLPLCLSPPPRRGNECLSAFLFQYVPSSHSTFHTNNRGQGGRVGQFLKNTKNHIHIYPLSWKKQKKLDMKSSISGDMYSKWFNILGFEFNFLRIRQIRI